VNEKARRANSVRVHLAADSSGASEDRRSRTGTVGWIRSFRYAGVDDESTLNVNVAILYYGPLWSFVVFSQTGEQTLNERK